MTEETPEPSMSDDDDRDYRSELTEVLKRPVDTILKSMAEKGGDDYQPSPSDLMAWQLELHRTLTAAFVIVLEQREADVEAINGLHSAHTNLITLLAGKLLEAGVLDDSIKTEMRNVVDPTGEIEDWLNN